MPVGRPFLKMNQLVKALIDGDENDDFIGKFDCFKEEIKSSSIKNLKKYLDETKAELIAGIMEHISSRYGNRFASALQESQKKTAQLAKNYEFLDKISNEISVNDQCLVQKVSDFMRQWKSFKKAESDRLLDARFQKDLEDLVIKKINDFRILLEKKDFEKCVEIISDFSTHLPELEAEYTTKAATIALYRKKILNFRNELIQNVIDNLIQKFVFYKNFTSSNKLSCAEITIKKEKFSLARLLHIADDLDVLRTAIQKISGKIYANFIKYFCQNPCCEISVEYGYTTSILMTATELDLENGSDTFLTFSFGLIKTLEALMREFSQYMGLFAKEIRLKDPKFPTRYLLDFMEDKTPADFNQLEVFKQNVRDEWHKIQTSIMEKLYFNDENFNLMENLDFICFMKRSRSILLDASNCLRKSATSSTLVLDEDPIGKTHCII